MDSHLTKKKKKKKPVTLGSHSSQYIKLVWAPSIRLLPLKPTLFWLAALCKQMATDINQSQEERETV